MPELMGITREFFSQIEVGLYEAYISQVVLDEIGKAPVEKGHLLLGLIGRYRPQVLELSTEVADLAQKYINGGVIPPSKVGDALHAAIATVYEMDGLITWNYRHLANLRKRDLINSVNLREGFSKSLVIITPMEVVGGEAG